MEEGGTWSHEAFLDVLNLLILREDLTVRDLSRLTCVATPLRAVLEPVITPAAVFRYKANVVKDHYLHFKGVFHDWKLAANRSRELPLNLDQALSSLLLINYVDDLEEAVENAILCLNFLIREDLQHEPSEDLNQKTSQVCESEQTVDETVANGRGGVPTRKLNRMEKETSLTKLKQMLKGMKNILERASRLLGEQQRNTIQYSLQSAPAAID